MSALADRERNRRQVWAAPGSNHDRLVAITRALLPLAIVVLFVAMAAAPLTSGRDISFVLSKDHVAVARERLRVTDATYRGRDTKGEAFAITAGSAVQQTSADPVVRLQQLTARIQLNDGPANIVADRGRYDMTNNRVLIDGPVRFTGPDRYAMATHDVVVNIDGRTVQSEAPVTGTMALGTFSANRMSADLNARAMSLDGRAHLHIVQSAGRAGR